MADPVTGRLRDARRRLRLSQTSVAKYLETSRQNVAAFEAGARPPNLQQLIRLANLYRQTLDELTGLRSVLRPSEPAMFHARVNRAGDLTQQDWVELSAFEQYLLQRPKPKERFSFQRQPFETVAYASERWRQSASLGRHVPVPIFAMLAQCGIEVRFTALEGLAGALLTSDGEHPVGVLINSDQPYDRQRYSAAHELGHLVLGHAAHDGAFINRLGRTADTSENQADQFAAELLVPSTLLRERAAQLPSEPLAHQVYRLACAFMVSFQAMVTRLAKLGSLSPVDADRLEKEKPSEIEKTLGLRKRQGAAKFNVRWLKELASKVVPEDWRSLATTETVRLLQEAAYADYLARVAEDEIADSAGSVYEQVAFWFADHFPLS